MKKIIIALAVLIIIGIGTYYLVFKDNSRQIPTNTLFAPSTSSEQNTDNPQVSAPTNNNVTPSNIVINIKDFAFSPATLMVKVGTKVTWTNSDNASHTVTSDSGNLLYSPNLSTGQSFSFTFNDTGTINYHCNIHKMMKGVILVTN